MFYQRWSCSKPVTVISDSFILDKWVNKASFAYQLLNRAHHTRTIWTSEGKTCCDVNWWNLDFFPNELLINCNFFVCGWKQKQNLTVNLCVYKQTTVNQRQSLGFPCQQKWTLQEIRTNVINHLDMITESVFFLNICIYLFRKRLKDKQQWSKKNVLHSRLKMIKFIPVCDTLCVLCL